MGVGRLRSDSGETLVEVLVALAVLSVAAVAILAGIEMSVRASDMHRKQTTGGAYVRSFAEEIEKYVSAGDNYIPCASGNAYKSHVISDLALPTGYEANHAAAIPLTEKGQKITSPSCPGDDKGIQQIQLTVRSNDGRATERLTVILRRACEGAACHPTP